MTNDRRLAVSWFPAIVGLQLMAVYAWVKKPLAVRVFDFGLGLLSCFGSLAGWCSWSRGLTHRRNGAGVCGRQAQILVQCHWAGVAQGIKWV